MATRVRVGEGLTLVCMVVDPNEDEWLLRDKVSLLLRECDVPSVTHCLGLLLLKWRFPAYQHRETLTEAARKGIRWLALSSEQTEQLEAVDDEGATVSHIVAEALPQATTTLGHFDKRKAETFRFSPSSPATGHQGGSSELDAYFAEMPVSGGQGEVFEVK